jgi:predicted DNA-binding transcriptional regulator AlpA
VTEEILRLPEVCRRTGLGRSALYAAIQEGSFPRQVKLSERAVGWLASDVDSWIEARVKARDVGATAAVQIP